MEILVAQPFWVLLLFSLGTFSSLKFLFSLVKTLYALFLRSPKNLLKYGDWAVVTGPTDGIGKAIAFELARRGLNLVLVGRNPHKLNQVFQEIKSAAPGLDLRIVVADFSGDLNKEIEQLKDAIKEINVGILVNNAGITIEQVQFLHEMEEEVLQNLVKVNLVGPTVVSAAVLPAMLPKRRGAIINIGSASITLPCYPLCAVYSCTKA